MPPRQDEGDVQKNGFLTCKRTGDRNYLVLRRGALRIYDAPSGQRRGAKLGRVLLAHRCEVRAPPGGCVEIQARLPGGGHHVFSAKSEAEAAAWCKALERDRADAQARLRGHLQRLAPGNTAYKYNYSNSKRMRRHFWVEESQLELCWGKSRNDEPQKINLKDCRGIIYGPVTTTFLRAGNLEDPPWACFSLMFSDRTMDLAVPGDAIDAWVLGLQLMLLERGTDCAADFSEPEFTSRKVFLKLTETARRQQLTTRTMLLQKLGALSRELGMGGKASIRRMTAPPAPSPAESAAEQDAKAKEERRKKRRDSKAEARATVSTAEELPPAASVSSRRATTPAAAKPFVPPKREAGGDTGPSKAATTAEQEEDLGKMVADLEQELEAATKRLEAVCPDWKSQSQDLADVFRSDGVSWQAEKCTELDREVLGLKLSNGGMERQLQASEKVEKQLKKLAKQFKESESQVQAMEQELQAAEAGAQSSETAQFSSAEALERATAQNQQLEKRVQELEQQLQQAEEGAEQKLLEQQNKLQAEELARLEREKADLEKKVEAAVRNNQELEKKHQGNLQQLAASEGLSKTLVGSLRRLQGDVAELRARQKEAKGECDTKLRSITDSFPPLRESIKKIGANTDSLMERHREMAEERRKLHNVVLELKGNIRVFVRVRPINEKEKPGEPAGESTITFAEDCKVSVYDGNNARRKWFEFDKAFPPKTAQQDVYEEVKPLATSVLDGFNVCIFAYGQTGSGKTFTMTGNESNPGLNTRVLTELFRIREERKLDTDITISLMITEIYNETIKDLFVTKQKKLEMRTNPDGTSSVPGLTELAVHSVEEVLKAMQDASANRTVMATDMNEESSRSHSIVQVVTKTKSRKEKDTREYHGKINLIDLAGSENVSKSGVTGQGVKEAQNINKSLSALGGVIAALTTKSQHVPYRDSKLTMMLKDSLGGDSKTLMIVQCSPAQCNVTETLSSLNFAIRAKNVELGKAKRNVKTGD